MRRSPVDTVLLAALVLLTSLPPAVAADADTALRALAAKAKQGEPLMRIGLEAGHRILVSSTTELRILDPVTGRPVWRESYDGEVAVIAEGGPTGRVPSVFRVQVGAYATEEAADAARSKVQGQVGGEVVVHRDPDRGNWRVRAGSARDRFGLHTLVQKLRDAGYPDLWIAEEPVREYADVQVRLVDASYNSEVSGLSRLAVVASGGGRVKVEGKPYRGVIEVRVTPFGTVRAINWVGLENYLLGVVPEELGPAAWPQLEALRAQAVAARTYAWRNRGQFEEEGFDQCATPRCQVYGGSSSEHPLSDRAVWSTRGEILSWQGKPINAYFTSTCGGHTEDVSGVFPGEQAPYLPGVECRAEASALASLRATVRGRAVKPVIDETGEDVTVSWALLRVSGVLPGEDESAMASALAPATLRAWTGALARLSGRPAPGGEPGPVDTLGKAVLSLLDDLGWRERTDVLLSDADLPALMRDPGTAGLPEQQRRALAYLSSLDGIRPFPDGSFRVDEPPTRARLLRALVRVGEAYEALGIRSGSISRVSGGTVKLAQGKGELKLKLAEAPMLFGHVGGKPVPSSALELWPGDRVRFHTGADGRIDLLHLIPPVRGTADDRSSAYYSWEQRRTRRRLEQAINQRVAVGRLEDLQVLRRGVSGRITELKVVGSKGSTVVRGFDVRRLLGLRESLTVVEPQRDSSGRLEAVVFAGKGWGHGVGLCQVGAYGMAVRGAGYREILSHYYPGTELRKTAGRTGS